ncbi:hypothetical protein ABGB17_04265 [Sphaerisporangium sp. B11E5]|uniref:hypothetical protein n=1 Tax=Sphaerisporangium sp. B11E5 TaxID=3153563 RepID=UPI00325E4731
MYGHPRSRLARTWPRHWDARQEHRVAQREARFAAIVNAGNLFDPQPASPAWRRPRAGTGWATARTGTPGGTPSATIPPSRPRPPNSSMITGGDHRPAVAGHVSALRAAGFARIGTVSQT